MWITPSGGRKLQLIYSTNGSTGLTAGNTAVTISVDTDYHYAITRDENDDVRFFWDGVLIETVNIGAVTLFNSSAVVSIGNQSNAVSGSRLSANGNSWVDDLRITKGVARYIKDFTPRVLAHPVK